jgi:nucleoside-diphosphate-sugar epimerase
MYPVQRGFSGGVSQLVCGPTLQRLMDPMARPVADDNARTEWGWRPVYGLEEMVDDFLQELRLHPKRYNSPSGAP